MKVHPDTTIAHRLHNQGGRLVLTVTSTTALDVTDNHHDGLWVYARPLVDDLTCDLCDCTACFFHPGGGARCGKCVRP